MNRRICVCNSSTAMSARYNPGFNNLEAVAEQANLREKKCVVVPADKASNKIVQRTFVITTLFATKDVAVN